MAADGIEWKTDMDAALAEAKASRKPLLLDFTAAPAWGGCARLEAETYPDPRVTAIVRDTFVPVRIQVRGNPDAMERFGVRWTPTVLLLDADGAERHRIEGFLPPEDFAAQLLLGLGHSAFATGDFGQAQLRFGQVLEELPRSDAAAESQYWKGVSRYKETNDPSALSGTYRAFQDRYRDTPWAKKASVWGPST